MKKVISAADSEKSHFKRDVSARINELKNKLRNEKPVMDHFYEVLSKSPVGKVSSLGQFLDYKYTKDASKHPS